MIKAIIFDCFGVVISDGLEAVCARLQQTNPEARAFIGECIRQNNSGILDPAESNRQIADYLGISMSQWRQLVDAGEYKDPEVLKWIHTLRKSYKTALLSNIGRGSLERRFSPEELTQHFDIVVASAEVGIMKPHPDIYKHTAELLGVEPEQCVFLDDREAFCQGAADVGMDTVWYQGLSQAKRELEQILGRV